MTRHTIGTDISAQPDVPDDRVRDNINARAEAVPAELLPPSSGSA